ncbi:MAG: GAF domain-containing protein, partial [Bacteroidota bacterium]
MSASLGLDIALVTTGLILVFLVWVMLRLLPRSQTAAQTALPAAGFPGYESSTDAVLVVQAGGRVEYLSDLAREWFALGDTEPAELERLTRRVRPIDDFLQVCAAPGKKRLTVNGKLLEATSFQIPGQYPLVLVSLRSLNLAPELEASGEAAGAILKTVTEFSQAVAASLDLESTLGSILNNISRLIPADFIELKVWEGASQTLIPYRFRGTGTGSHVLVRASRSQFTPLTDQLVSRREPIILSGAEIAPPELSARVQSYLGVPLLAGGDLVGTLEAGQMGSAAFGQHDLDLVRFVSGQAAIAIR